MNQTLITDYNVGLNNLFNINTLGVSQGFRQRVIDKFNPVGGTPPAPSVGAKYISIATANGWIINTIEYYSGLTNNSVTFNGWMTISPQPGDIVWIDSQTKAQIWNGVAWIDFGAPLPTDYVFQNPAAVGTQVPTWTDARHLNSTGVTITQVGPNWNMLVPGKLTVTGLLDPTGLELTPIVGNPGGVAANTLWLDFADSNKLKKGTQNVLLYDTSIIVPADNQVPKFSGPGANQLNATGVTIDDLDQINAAGIQLGAGAEPMIIKISNANTLIDAPAVVPSGTTVSTQAAIYEFVRYNMPRIKYITSINQNLANGSGAPAGIKIESFVQAWLINPTTFSFDLVNQILSILKNGHYHITIYTGLQSISLSPPQIVIVNNDTNTSMGSRTVNYNSAISPNRVDANFELTIAAGTNIRFEIFMDNLNMYTVIAGSYFSIDLIGFI
jgi:hypothetical protein